MNDRISAEQSIIDALLKVIQAGAGRRLVALSADNVDDWSSLNAAESAVFGLTPEDMPLLCEVWKSWLILIGDLHAPMDEELIAKARLQLPVVKAVYAANPRLSPQCEPWLKGWVAFATVFGLPAKQAYAFALKVHCHELRSGIVVFADDV